MLLWIQYLFNKNIMWKDKVNNTYLAHCIKYNKCTEMHWTIKCSTEIRDRTSFLMNECIGFYVWKKHSESIKCVGWENRREIEAIMQKNNKI